jgi:hypothetical protein
MTRHRTAKGREFNMAAFAQANDQTPAVGNVPRNAAGDVLGPDGRVKVAAKDLQTSYYNRSPNAVKTVSIKEDGTVTPIIEDAVAVEEKPAKAAKVKKATQEVETVKEYVDAAGTRMKEITYVDGTMEVVEAE